MRTIKVQLLARAPMLGYRQFGRRTGSTHLDVAGSNPAPSTKGNILNKNAKRILADGWDEMVSIEKERGISEIDVAQGDMLKVIAVMLDAAVNPPKKAKRKPKLLYTELDILARLPVQLAVARHGGLNTRLRSMTLHDTDLDQFEIWFRESMYPWMLSKPDFQFTFSMLSNKYGEWLEKARQFRGDVTQGKKKEQWR